MDYYEFTCDSHCLSVDTQELLTAFLAEIGFESFNEENGQYKAYIQCMLYDAKRLQDMLRQRESCLGTFPYTIEFKASEDWNKQWEDSFTSVEINNDIVIRTPDCKPQKRYLHEILIQPRMAFGSGTHETTSLILQTMRDIDFQRKTVADCGCGTGILGIFASLLGASNVFAFDYDQNSVENARTNVTLNNITNVSIQQATLDVLQNKQFDIVLANINRNVLVENMKFLANAVNNNGLAIMSGFYSEDVAYIQKSAESFGLQFITSKSKNNWTIVTFIRK